MANYRRAVARPRAKGVTRVAVPLIKIKG